MTSRFETDVAKVLSLCREISERHGVVFSVSFSSKAPQESTPPVVTKKLDTLRAVVLVDTCSCVPVPNILYEAEMKAKQYGAVLDVYRYLNGTAQVTFIDPRDAAYFVQNTHKTQCGKPGCDGWRVKHAPIPSQHAPTSKNLKSSTVCVHVCEHVLPDELLSVVGMKCKEIGEVSLTRGDGYNTVIATFNTYNDACCCVKKIDGRKCGEDCTGWEARFV